MMVDVRGQQNKKPSRTVKSLRQRVATSREEVKWLLIQTIFKNHSFPQTKVVTGNKKKAEDDEVVICCCCCCCNSTNIHAFSWLTSLKTIHRMMMRTKARMNLWMMMMRMRKKRSWFATTSA